MMTSTSNNKPTKKKRLPAESFLVAIFVLCVAVLFWAMACVQLATRPVTLQQHEHPRQHPQEHHHQQQLPMHHNHSSPFVARLTPRKTKCRSCPVCAECADCSVCYDDISKQQHDLCTADYCREHVFVYSQSSAGSGTSLGEFTNLTRLRQDCQNKPLLFNSCQELQDFTGLSDEEFWPRLARSGPHHFVGEHLYRAPRSATELSWFYMSSVNYLYGNAVHAGQAAGHFEALTIDHVPILDYSAGVGNINLRLAARGIPSMYFGIGQLERSFAEYRFRKRGLLQNGTVHMIAPWNDEWKLDPIRAALPRNSSLGAILAIDVLEHIPNYHVVVQAMVKSLRVGGIIIENSPFAAHNTVNGDTRIHVGDGGVNLIQAMGNRMELEQPGFWRKVR